LKISDGSIDKLFANWARELSGASKKRAAHPLAKDRKLSPERLRLFSDNLDLARIGTFAYLRGRPHTNFDDVHALALDALWSAADLFNGEGSFEGFAAWKIKTMLRAHHIKPCGDVSLDAPLGDSDFTIGDIAESLSAQREMQAQPGDDRRAALLFEIREALRSKKLLTSRERQALKLRYIDGLEVAQIAPQLHFSDIVIKRTIRSGVRKLRAHFAKRLPTLPIM
jgi:RNA polymerase sigma factor (sigma-70 family)